MCTFYTCIHVYELRATKYIYIYIHYVTDKYHSLSQQLSNAIFDPCIRYCTINVQNRQLLFFDNDTKCRLIVVYIIVKTVSQAALVVHCLTRTRYRYDETTELYDLQFPRSRRIAINAYTVVLLYYSKGQRRERFTGHPFE